MFLKLSRFFSFPFNHQLLVLIALIGNLQLGIIMLSFIACVLVRILLSLMCYLSFWNDLFHIVILFGVFQCIVSTIYPYFMAVYSD